MAIINMSKVYDLAEIVEVQSAASAVTIYTAPAGSIINRVIVRVKTAGAGSSPTVEIGDATDPDGFIVASAADGAAGTVYGDAIAEVGAYLKVATGATSGYAPSPSGKVYTTATAILVTEGGTTTTHAVLQVIILGKRMNL